MNQTEYEKQNICKTVLYDELYPKKTISLPCGTLFQVAEVALIRGSEIADHIQGSDELTYAISGKATFYADDAPTEICGGEIHYIKKGMHHRIVTDTNESFRYICIGLNPKQNYSPIAPYLQKIKEADTLVAVDNGKFKRLCELLIDEMYTPDYVQTTMLNTYLTGILLTFFRILNGNTSPRRVNKASSSFTVYHLMRYIDNKYMSISDIKSVADELSYSEYYLSHLFKEKIGIGIKEYITHKKLSAAADMLAGGMTSINEVTEKIGYSSAHTFRQAFKRYFGVTPTEYTMNMKAETRKD